MKDELTEQDCHYIIRAVDAYIRQNGLAQAAAGLVVVKKVQDFHDDCKDD